MAEWSSCASLIMIRPAIFGPSRCGAGDGGFPFRTPLWTPQAVGKLRRPRRPHGFARSTIRFEPRSLAVAHIIGIVDTMRARGRSVRPRPEAPPGVKEAVARVENVSPMTGPRWAHRSEVSATPSGMETGISYRKGQRLRATRGHLINPMKIMMMREPCDRTGAIGKGNPDARRATSTSRQLPSSSCLLTFQRFATDSMNPVTSTSGSLGGLLRGIDDRAQHVLSPVPTHQRFPRVRLRQLSLS